MARQFVAVQDQYLEVDSAPVASAPLTVACWFNHADATQNQTLMWVGDRSLDTDYFGLSASGGGAAKDIVFITNDGTSRYGVSTDTYTQNTWHHAAGVTSSPTSRYGYLDGSPGSEDTNSAEPLGVDRTSIGRYGRSSGGVNFDGQIAEAAIWADALTTDEVAALAARFPPTAVRPDALVFYAPLNQPSGDDYDWVGGLTLTDNATVTAADHPPIMRHPVPVVGKTAAVSNDGAAMYHHFRNLGVFS